MKKEIKKIKALMMQSLEQLDEKGINNGDFVCHEDIPSECPEGFDAYFTAVGEDVDKAYVVLIQEVKM